MLSLSFVLLVGAWIAATVPFAAPDEASHYLRAMEITHGEILGPRVNYPPPPGITRAQLAFVDHDTRAVVVPAQLSPPDVTCMNGVPDIIGRCLEATPDGNFPPLGYLLPAAALSAAHDTGTGLWLTRAASAVQSLAFLLLAIALLWDGSGWSVLGLLVATTPMVLFVFSVMNSSGVEIASSLAFASAAVRISRDPPHAPRWVWIAFALAGSVAMLTGPIGLAFVVLDLLLFAALLGRRGARELIRRSPRALAVAGLTLLAAAIVSIVYTRLAGFDTRLGISPIRSSLVGGLHQLPPVLRDAVGTFGSLTVPLPTAARWIWWLLALGLVVVAVVVGDRRERLLVGVVVIVCLVFPVLFGAWSDRYSGYDVQGREVLPVLMLIPLVGGEIVGRKSAAFRDRRWPAVAMSLAIALIAGFQAYAWWVSARVAAGAPNTIRFYAHASWSPPLGWAPWIAAAGLGAVAMLAFGACDAIARRSRVPEQAPSIAVGA